MSELPMALIVRVYMLTFCRMVIRLVVLISGVHRTGHFPQFKQTIIASHLLPNQQGTITARLLLAGGFGVVPLIIPVPRATVLAQVIRVRNGF